MLVNITAIITLLDNKLSYQMAFYCHALLNSIFRISHFIRRHNNNFGQLTYPSKHTVLVAANELYVNISLWENVSMSALKGKICPVVWLIVWSDANVENKWVYLDCFGAQIASLKVMTSIYISPFLLPFCVTSWIKRC